MGGASVASMLPILLLSIPLQHGHEEEEDEWQQREEVVEIEE